MKLLGKKDKERLARLAKRVNETSNADFVKRLLDERRKYLVNDDGSFSTHELAYRDDGNGNAVVYPAVQNVLGGLHRFDDDMAYDRALYRGDTLNMRTPDAKLFTENYKREYPMYFQPELAPVGDLTSAYNLAPPEARPLWRNTYLYDPSSPVEEMSPQAVLDAKKDAARRIMAVENSKANANGGWDAKTGRWYPHKSHEGGADTIAYGIKLSNGTPEAALALRQGYLTDEQAESAVDTLVQKYYDAAKKVYDGKYGAGEWDKLSDKSQSILVDYSYNPGLAKFPSLMEGFHSGDMDLIRKNYKRYSGGKELGRNKTLLEEIDTLENEYPIFRASGGKIHIAPSKRGTFTAAAKAHGKSVQGFASQVLAHKENYSPAMVKKANFARNAAKWHHADGGFLNRYDGETEKTGWLRRFLNTRTMVPNMTGTATGAATGLRDIPLTESTVGKELAVAGTALASPLLVSAPGATVNWLSNPANQILAGKFVTPLVGAGAFDQAVKNYTPYSSWGDAIVSGTGLGEVMDYALLPDAQKDLVRAGAEFTNPAFFAPYEGIAKGISGLTDRAAGYLRNFRNTLKNGEWVDATATVEPTTATVNGDELVRQIREASASARPARDFGETLRGLSDDELNSFADQLPTMQMYSPEDYPTSLTDVVDNEIALRNLRRLGEGRSDMIPYMGQTTVEPEVNLPDIEGLQGLVDDLSLDVGEITMPETFTQWSARQPRIETPATVATPVREVVADSGVPLSERSYEELGRLLRDGQFSRDEVNSAMRERAWRELGFRNNRHDLADLSMDDLVRLTESYSSPQYPREALDHVNNGLFSYDIDYLNTWDLRQNARTELRNRMQNHNVPANYSSLEEAARDYDLFGRVNNYRQQDNVLRSAAPDLRIAIGRQEDIPEPFMGNIGRIVSDMYDRGVIDENNRYFADALNRNVGDLSRLDIVELLDKYADLTGRNAFVSDNSKYAVDKLVSRFGKELPPDEIAELSSKFGRSVNPWEHFYDYRDLLGKINNIEALPAAEQEEMRKIINSAYGYSPRHSPVTPSKKYMGDLIAKEFDKRLPADYTGNRDITTLFDPYSQNYVELAEATRGAGAHRLPSDVDHLSWFQVQSAADENANAVEQAYKTAQGTQLAGIQTELLTRALPRQTAIVEHNTSPNSYKVMTKGSLRAPEGFGYGPGQVTLEPVNVKDWTATMGNTAQLRKAKFDADGKMIFGQPTEGVEPYMFTRDEAQKLLDELENTSTGDLETYFRNSPEARELVDKTIRLAQQLNKADIRDVSKALELVNKKRVKLGKEPIALPTETDVPLTSESPDFYEHSNLIKISSDVRRVLNNLLSSDGFAARMNRTPIITLRHKYGGLINRLGSFYGDDKDGMKVAFINARKKQKN